jgi:predicted ATP-grasp superfamily ATP-dependent carboligase
MVPRSDSVTPAVVIGLGINGLGTVRSLGRAGIPVYGLTGGKGDPGEYSRYCEKVVCRDMSSPDAMVESLVALGRRLPDKSVLFPSGDLSLEIVSEHRDELAPFFHFPFPSRDTVRLVLHKGRFVRFAVEHKLPMARTFFPDSIEALREVARTIHYPCLLKPSVAGAEWRHQGLKLLAANTPAELEAVFQRAVVIERDLIIQEVTPGPDSSLQFSLTYLNGEGRPLAMFTGRKLRQYVPRFGISSMAVSLWSPDIDRLTRDTLAALRYTGYGSVEFKRHAETGEFLMTEVTARTWYPHALSERCGINLPAIAYHDLLGLEPYPVPTGFPDGAKWIDEVNDFKSGLYYWRQGELTLGGWLASYRGRRFWARATADDPKPFLMLLVRLATQGAKAILRPLVRPFRRSTSIRDNSLPTA